MGTGTAKRQINPIEHLSPPNRYTAIDPLQISAFFVFINAYNQFSAYSWSWKKVLLFIKGQGKASKGESRQIIEESVWFRL